MNNIPIIYFLFSLVLCVQACAGSQKLEKQSPIPIRDAFYEDLIGGRAEEGLGIRVGFKTVRDASITLDSVYFKGLRIPLAFRESDTTYTGSKTFTSKREDLTMHSDPAQEFKNNLSPIDRESKPPFTSSTEECLVLFRRANKKGYFKIKLRKKKIKHFPLSTPRKRL